MNRMIRLRTALIYAAAVVVLSNTAMWVFGSVYFSTRIDDAFDGLCGILVYSSEPFPRPPSNGTQPSPTSPYGKALAEYNKKVADRQQRGLEAVNRAVDKYHCK
jgi:hypothetical protein